MQVLNVWMLAECRLTLLFAASDTLAKAKMDNILAITAIVLINLFSIVVSLAQVL
jgi:hypothetical protein